MQAYFLYKHLCTNPSSGLIFTDKGVATGAASFRFVIVVHYNYAQACEQNHGTADHAKIYYLITSITIMR